MSLKPFFSFAEKVKVCFGNMFIKFPKTKTIDMIQKGKCISSLNENIQLFIINIMWFKSKALL